MSFVSSHYRKDSADIYAVGSHAEGNIKVDGKITPAYSAVAVNAQKENYTKFDAILGRSMLNRFKIIIPLSNSTYPTITIKPDYQISLTLFRNTTVLKLRVTDATPHYNSHWEVEAEEYGV